MKYIVALGLLLLALSVPGVNFYHHLLLPKVSTERVLHNHTWNFNYPFVHKNTHIRLESEIKGQERFDDVNNVLVSAEPGDVITFHLSGYGGSSQTMYELINNVKTCKAKVVMVVEAPVYSAHAYLAAVGDQLIMKDFSFMMFHCSSILNVDCTQEGGFDRGVPNSEHCQAMKDQLLKMDMDLVLGIPFLKFEEEARIMLGHDVYITSQDYGTRLFIKNTTGKWVK